MKRKLRIILHLLLILLSIGILRALAGTPSPTAEIAFRRDERQLLLGPAEIIDTVTLRHWYDHTMLGVSEYGYSVYRWNASNGYDSGYLAYYPKDGSITLVGPNVHDGLWNYKDWQVPFLAFTDLAGASTATLQLTLTYEETTEVFTLEATKRSGQYFLFPLSAQEASTDALKQLHLATSATYVSGNTLTAKITVYDRQGIPLETKDADFTRQ